MNNFKVLYGFELKKIFRRKIVCITMVIMLVISLWMAVMQIMKTYTYTDAGTGKKVEMSGYEMLQRDKRNALTMEGRLIDNELLAEVRECYQGVYYSGDFGVDGLSEEDSVKMSITLLEEESPADAEMRMKERERLKRIQQYVGRIAGNDNAIHVISAKELYHELKKDLQESMFYQKLTEGEKAYWMQEAEKISTPFVYGYADGYEMIIGEVYSLNVMLLLAIVICLSTVFSEEHVRKTDQLILCSKYGKKTLYMAKMVAGITFGCICAVAMLITSVVPTVFIYGAEGFDVALQIYSPFAHWNISMGEAAMIMILIYLVVAVFYSILTMFLSEALRNSVAVMGIMFGGMLFTLCYTPYTEFRIFNQIYELLPTMIFGMWEFMDLQMVKVFGVYFRNLQIAPILYIVCSVILVIWGRKIYKSYQVSGR